MAGTLFHVPSGTTHIVAPPVPQLLEALAPGPCDTGEILARMRAWYDFDENGAADIVDARLEELEAAGLIRRL